MVALCFSNHHLLFEFWPYDGNTACRLLQITNLISNRERQTILVMFDFRPFIECYIPLSVKYPVTMSMQYIGALWYFCIVSVYSFRHLRALTIFVSEQKRKKCIALLTASFAVSFL